jgi:hypothetical protein
MPFPGPPQPPNAGGYGNQSPEEQYGGGGPETEYDFIMNPNKPRRQVPIGLPGGGGNMAMRITILAVGLVILVVVGGTIASLLNKPKVSTTDLVSIAQTQSELARIAAIGVVKGNDQSILNSAFTTNISIISDQRQLLIYLAKNNVKLDAKKLTLKKNTQTDARLAAALAASTFDSTFKDILQTQLTSYQRALKAAYNTNPGPNGQKLLAAEYKSAGLLLAQTQQQ